jgi:hypothetical protein
MALTPYVLLTHTASDGSDAQVLACCGGGRLDAIGDAPPATVSPRRWTPCLDVASMSPLVERVVDGRATKALAPVADVSVKLTSYLAPGGPTWPLAIGRIILGQSIEVGYVGTDASGTVWTMSARLVIATGTVGPWSDGRRLDQMGRQVGGISVTIRSHPALWDGEVPPRKLLGYPGGVLGVSTSGPTGYSTVPVDFSWQCLCLLPLKWTSAYARQVLVYHPTVRWYGKQVAADAWQLCAEFTIDGGGTLEELAGPVVAPDEAFHWLDFTFDTAAAGGGVEAIFGVDGERTTVASATALYATAGDWRLFEDGVAYNNTISGAYAFFGAAQTGAQLDAYQVDRLTGSETDLVLYYPGPVTSTGKLLDGTRNDAGGPYDIMLGGAGAGVSLLEGDEPLAGTRLPHVYYAQSLPGVIVGAADSIYRFTSARAVEGVGLVHARGAEWTAYQSDDLRDFLGGSAPAAGEVTVCAFGGGLVRRGSPVVTGTDESLVADIRGVGGGSSLRAPWSLALGSNYGGSLVTFAGWNALLSGLTEWQVDLRVSIQNDPDHTFDTIFQSDWLKVWMLSAAAAGLGRPLMWVQVEGTTGTVSNFYDLGLLTTSDVSVCAWNSGSDLAVRVVLNGNATVPLQSGGTVPTISTGNALLTTGLSASPTLSTATASTQAPYLGVLPMRWWSATEQGTNAEAETAVRKFLYRDPVDGTDAEYADLVSLWHGPQGDALAAVEDLVGSNDGVISSGTHWRPPLCQSDPVGAAVHMLVTLGGYALSAVDIDDSAYGLHGAQSLWIGPEITTPAEAVDLAMGPGYALLRGDGTVVLGAPIAAEEANARGTLSAADVFEWSDRDLAVEAGYAGPPSRVETAWGRVGLKADPLPTAPEDLAALISREVGSTGVDCPSWGLYGDLTKQRVMILPGQYRDRDRAQEAAAAAAVIYGSGERPAIVVRLTRHYLTDYRAGDVVGLWDHRAGAVVWYFIRQVTYTPEGTGVGDIWEVF